MSETPQTFTREEVALHNTKESLWLIIDSHVFDVTSFQNHPGGYELLLSHGGQDATEDFNDISGHHDGYANGLLDKFCLGKLKDI